MQEERLTPLRDEGGDRCHISWGQFVPNCGVNDYRKRFNIAFLTIPRFNVTKKSILFFCTNKDKIPTIYNERYIVTYNFSLIDHHALFQGTLYEYLFSFN